MLLLKNGRFATMNEAQPMAEAVVVDGELFAYVGDNSGAEAYVRENCRTEAEIIDLNGGFVVPGFNDSHMHFIHYVKAKNSVDLFGVSSMAELKAAMRRGLEKAELRGGRFLMGEGWNHENFTDEKRFPTRRDLDEISRDVPIIIMRACFHIGVLNSKAMEILGLNRESAKKQGDFVELDEQGEPNGVIKENYLDDIKAALPSASLEELLESVLSAQKDLFSLGITSVQSDDFKYAPDNRPYELMQGLREVSENGLLKLRISEQALLTEQDSLDEFFARENAAMSDSRDCRVSTIKLLADGSLGGRTAYMLQAYADDSDNFGLAIYEQEQLDKLVLTAHEHNMPVAIHTIGDGSVEMALMAIERAQKAAPQFTPRHGLVHCQVMNRAQLERMKSLGVQAYTQPVFINGDMHIAPARLGEERVKSSYSWGAMLQLGIAQSFGTDSPVEGLNPMAGIYCAVSRCDFEGCGPFLPEQAISVDQALYAYTAAGAYASGDEKIKGKIMAGMLADFVLLDRDLYSCPAAEILQTRVLRTWVGGECVYVSTLCVNK